MLMTLISTTTHRRMTMTMKTTGISRNEKNQRVHTGMEKDTDTVTATATITATQSTPATSVCIIMEKTETSITKALYTACNV
jgi:hypothetical protein